MMPCAAFFYFIHKQKNNKMFVSKIEQHFGIDIKYENFHFHFFSRCD